MEAVVYNGRKIVIIIMKMRTTGNKKYSAKIRGIWTDPAKGIKIGNRIFWYDVFPDRII